MKVHTLDVESSQRDPTLYAYANSYVITLENPVYDVSMIELVSARIPTKQFDVCATNQTFSVDGTNITLPTRDYANVQVLSDALQTALAPPNSNVDVVTYFDDHTLLFSNTLGEGHFTFEFNTGTHGYQSNVTDRTTPHELMGFGSADVSSNASYQVRSGPANFSGPNALCLRLTTGSDDFTKHVYTGTPFYTGKLLLDGSDVLDFRGNDDPLVYEFHGGAQKVMDTLKIEFFYMSHGKLIPYDFRNQEHALKFKITCSTDRLENLTRHVEPEELVLPPPIKVDVDEKTDLYKWIPIGVIILLGIVLLTLIDPRPRRPGPSGAPRAG